ncbi:hypothetical protein VNO77_03737 [Canavalia gladiata]|uniref:Uncharacterized protein n=1 Tax=Canavalia gladiata TaxID=3824 RepID=A0AAN9MVE2_CANGL
MEPVIHHLPGCYQVAFKNINGVFMAELLNHVRPGVQMNLTYLVLLTLFRLSLWSNILDPPKRHAILSLESILIWLGRGSMFFNLSFVQFSVKNMEAPGKLASELVPLAVGKGGDNGQLSPNAFRDQVWSVYLLVIGYSDSSRLR